MSTIYICAAQYTSKKLGHGKVSALQIRSGLGLRKAEARSPKSSAFNKVFSQ